MTRPVWLLALPVAVFLSLAAARSPAAEGSTGAAAPAFDHAATWRSLNEETLARGEAFYDQVCAACHGYDGSATLPTARSFGHDRLQHGHDPYSMWQTLTYGRGMMAAQTWLTPVERYYVIQYIREAIFRPFNPSQYFEVTEAYLATLPTAADEAQDLALAAASGSQAAGQAWARQHPGDYGHTAYSQLEGVTSSALTLALDHGVWVSYDLLRTEQAAAWQGTLDLSSTKMVNYRGEGKPRMAGQPLEGLSTWYWGLRGTRAKITLETPVRSPLPRAYIDFKGHYTGQDHAILSYDVMGRSVLDQPSSVALPDGVALVNTLRLAPATSLRKLYVGQGPRDTEDVEGGIFPRQDLLHPDPPRQALATGRLAVLGAPDSTFLAVGVRGQTEQVILEIDRHHRLVVHLPPSETPLSLQVVRFRGDTYADLQGFASWLSNAPAPVPDLRRQTVEGTTRWIGPVTTTTLLDVPRPHHDPAGDANADSNTPAHLVDLPADYPYTVDEIGLPYANPWDAWIRPTDLDFFPDGRLVLGTYTGDVWVATLQADDRWSWQRFATGLYEPMGVRVVRDEVYVTARNGIVRLHDLNGDGEADFYENFYQDLDVSDFFHAFAFGLEADPAGNWYYAKSGQYTNNRHPGDIVKIWPDGTRSETYATGFRTPNGVTVSPGGDVYVSDNQGNWMPANKISRVRRGEFYGYVQNLASPHWSPDGILVDENGHSPLFDYMDLPNTFVEPMLWMPQELDSSPGGGTWSAPGWGPLGDRFIHTSFGKGWIYHVMPQTVRGHAQGAIAALPFQFDAGVQRASVNPQDGQVYVVGLTGWDDGFATRYGTLNRIRFTGGEAPLLVDASVRPDGLALTFSHTLDAAFVTTPDQYTLHQWNYRWTASYGSEDWSVADPNQTGRDAVAVQAVRLSDDGRTLLLDLPRMLPVDQLRVQYRVRTTAGVLLKDRVYFTIHQIPSTGDL